MSTKSQTIDVEIELGRCKSGRRGRKNSAMGLPSPHFPGITRLMVLAIKFQGMIDRGEVRDYAELARVGFVTHRRPT
jgi:hypothetical protein